MSNKEGLPEKDACFIPLQGFDCPSSCAGMLAVRFFNPGNSGEGVMVQVCPNPEYSGQHSSGANYCGNGPDVLTIYRDTIPTDEEYQQEIRDFEW